MPTAAILAWPIVAIALFAQARFVAGLIWCVLLPYLFLPEAFAINVPGFPDLDKTNIISFSLLLVLILFGERFRGQRRAEPVTIAHSTFRVSLIICLSLLLMGLVLTVLTNREPLFFGPVRLPGMRVWDLVSIVGQLLLIFVPFQLARQYLMTPETHRQLLSALVAGAIVYSAFMLVEIRLSPQLHNWIYGYHQHSFLQHIRDGYRPKVFLQHGIWVGFYIFMALIAAIGLWKATGKQKWLLSALWVFAILAISRNLGALSIALLCSSVFILVGGRALALFVSLIAVAVLFYPALRQANLAPIEQIVEVAKLVSEDRAGSLEFRLRNEDQLLERAYQKPLAGWGSWDRDQVFDGAGRDVSVSEGRWIQTLGRWGWLGYIGLYGILTLPLILLPVTRKRKDVPPETMALALICVGNLIYTIPNSTLTPVSWIVFGALAGFVQFDRLKQNEAKEPEMGPNRVRRYTRFPKQTGPSEA